MTDIVLLRPWWLAALPLLLLLGLWSWRRGPHAGAWRQVMPAPMLAAMQELGHLQAGKRQAGLSCLLAAATLAAGLAGPAVPRGDAPVLAGSGAVLIAMDMSRSVAGSPALNDAQTAAAQILTTVNGRAVGLILYNGEAYDIAAPTSDPSTLETQIAVLGPETMPGDGSRPAAALALARQMLSQVPDGDLILITDGGGIGAAAVTEAERLTSSGIRLSVLALSDAAGPAVPPEVFDKLPNISALAPARSPGPVLRLISTADSWRGDQTIASLRFLDLGPFVAILSLFPLLGLFRRTI
ncbi:VWA domain-containing protein [Roseibium litorale]|uniref:VWA domain-containing protein n=1 Tax=Roseibium litorale TaxID=2803841 RepID=A0ABR9CT66_9HYPH|nr:vWA domain-containing protein [Roseibium litorale]MBD8894077.1 VWA domain-containing protein [Roseibium litorale]